MECINDAKILTILPITDMVVVVSEFANAGIIMKGFLLTWATVPLVLHLNESITTKAILHPTVVGPHRNNKLTTGGPDYFFPRLDSARAMATACLRDFTFGPLFEPECSVPRLYSPMTL